MMTSGKKRYFAYGSNMLATQARRRVPAAKAVGTAILAGWRVVERLTADIERAEGCRTYGVLFELREEDLATMDRFEGAPKVYRRKTVRVNFKGRLVRAVTYVMTKATVAKRGGKPYKEDYRKRCSDGARTHRIPDAFGKEQE